MRDVAAPDPGDVEIAAPSTAALLRLGEDFAFGDTWRAALGGAEPLAPRERISLLVSVRHRLLVATEGGRARLRRWLDARGTTPTTVEGIADSVAFFGDPSLLAPVARALAITPPPVRDAALREVAFCAVGFDSAAWTSSANFFDQEGNRKTTVILVSPLADVAILLHETAHAWHRPLPREHSQRITIRGEAGLFRLAAEQGWHDRASAQITRDEALADALAAIWIWLAESEHR